MKYFLNIVFFSLIALVSGCETTNTEREASDSINAKSGQEILLRAFYNVNPDCSLNGVPKVIVASAPAHGVVTTSTVSDFPHYANSDPRHKCNARKVPKQAAFYTPESGFVGVDHIKLRAVGNDGPNDLQFVTFKVNVTK
ncbi:hypothetical protein [Mesorhizobium sp. YR577]|uniref:hypothetical protein n=1 Tax=Mesorhizobium sp. YR577 TaxID=1884373 RepID=UPI0008EF46F3|nr:hypothetical protein [Mesorhizobium sp. YR577]SFT90934.1 hypothetical protein SAMN05518861_107113 [Mesorhizobium sp. YR577]